MGNDQMLVGATGAEPASVMETASDTSPGTTSDITTTTDPALSAEQPPAAPVMLDTPAVADPIAQSAVNPEPAEPEKSAESAVVAESAPSENLEKS